LPANAGILASAGWLAARGLFIPPDRPWDVNVVIGAVEHHDSALSLHIRNDDWSVAFQHDGKRSAIVINEVAPTADPDDFGLAGLIPPLKEIGVLLRDLEQRFRIRFQRTAPVIESTIAGSEPIIRAWIASL
jgi:hypothetical protein